MASKAASRVASSLSRRATPQLSPSLTRRAIPPGTTPPRPRLTSQASSPVAPLARQTQTRLAHAIPRPPPQPSAAPSSPRSSPSSVDGEPLEATSDAATAQQQPPSRVQTQPHYQLTFTCIPCGGRSGHVVSKQGYHHGSVLITCPDCHNRHVISDHLGIFGDRKMTVEDLMRERGRLVKKGTLGDDGDIEFWEDDRGEGGVPPSG